MSTLKVSMSLMKHLCFACHVGAEDGRYRSEVCTTFFPASIALYVSIYFALLLASQNLFQVKPGCDFATRRLAAQNPPSFVLCFMPHTTNDLFTLLSKATRAYSTHACIVPTRDRSSSRRYARHYSRPTGHRHRLWPPLARFKSHIGSIILTCSPLVSRSSLITYRQKMLLSRLSRTWPSTRLASSTLLRTALLVLTMVSGYICVPNTLLRRSHISYSERRRRRLHSSIQRSAHQHGQRPPRRPRDR
jgi:hypothetical protein